MPAGRCSGNLFLGIEKGLTGYPVDAGASCPSANVWRRDGRTGVTSKGAPILTRNGRAFGRSARFGQGVGWLARKPSSRVVPGPRTMAKLLLRGIQGRRPCTMARAPGIPAANWQAFSDGRSSPDAQTAEIPVLFVQSLDLGIDDWRQESPHR